MGHRATSVFPLWHLTKNPTKLSSVLGYSCSRGFGSLPGCSHLSRRALSKLTSTLRFSMIEHLGHIHCLQPFLSWQFQRYSLRLSVFGGTSMPPFCLVSHVSNSPNSDTGRLALTMLIVAGGTSEIWIFWSFILRSSVASLFSSFEASIIFALEDSSTSVLKIMSPFRLLVACFPLNIVLVSTTSTSDASTVIP